MGSIWSGLTGGCGRITAVEAPAGTVTFLFTDIEGSSRLWEEQPEGMGVAVARHDQMVVESICQHAGTVVKTRGEGDSVFAVFARASDALGAALDLQQALGAGAWPAGVVLRVRAAVHSGEAELRDGDYFGGAVNRCARLGPSPMAGRRWCRR
jgi:class 3 adenylate cyclase